MRFFLQNSTITHCPESGEWSVNNSSLPRRLRLARRACSWPSLHVNELSRVRPQASVQTHTLLCFDKVTLEYCSRSHDLTCWVKLKRNVILDQFNLNTIHGGFMECSRRYWLSLQSKKMHQQHTHRSLSRWERRFFIGETAGSCAEAELQNWAFDNLHTLISELHISRTGGNLIRLVVLQEHSSILLFFHSGWYQSSVSGRRRD